MSDAVQTRTVNKTTLKGRLESDDFKVAVSRVLPRHLTPERFVRVAIMAMTKTPRLADCDQASFFRCLMDLSQMGLEPDGRRAHLIPFRNNRKNITECQLIVDYKGLAELVMRSGIVSFIHADVVCETDVFEYDRGEIRAHKIDFKKPRGAVYAAYALVRFKDGTEKSDVMSKDEVESIRKRSRAANDGPWVTDWNEMAKKTVFRRLSKWLSLSPEFRDALDKDVDSIEDQRFANAKTVNFELPDSSLVEVAGETANGEQTQEQKPEAEQPKDKPEPEQPKLTPQTDLQKLVTEAGFTFTQFQQWGVTTGRLKDADSLASFDQVKDADAKRLLRISNVILDGLKALAEGDAQ